MDKLANRRLESSASDHRDGRRLTRKQALPRQTGDQPVELLAGEVQRARILARPGEAASLQAPGAQPHARAVVDQHLEPVGPAIGKHVGVVGLRAQREVAYQRGQQRVDAPAQIAGAQRQPDDVAPLGRRAGAGPALTPATPSSRACQRWACAHQLANARGGTPLASAHTRPF